MGDLHYMNNNISRESSKNVPALTARDVGYSVNETELLNNITFSIHQGGFIGVIGPNGAGKTTLLRAISRLLKIKHGMIAIKGEDLGNIPAKKLARSVGQVQQIAPNTHGFQGLEVVLMGRYPHLSKFQVERESDRQISRDAM